MRKPARERRRASEQTGEALAAGSLRPILISSHAARCFYDSRGRTPRKQEYCGVGNRLIRIVAMNDDGRLAANCGVVA
jgi:hypothetical protein